MSKSTVGLGLALVLAAAPATVLAQSSSEEGAGATAVLCESPLSYLVNRGDTLIDIARKYLRSPNDYRQLQRDNRVANPRRMATGRSLSIEPALLRTRDDPARLESFRGEVRVERNGTTVSPSQDALLREGDIISTGPSAFVRIAFSDGTHTVVPSQSRLRLERLRRFVINDAPDYRLVVDRGRVESRVSPRQRPGGFRVITPTSVSAVRGTSFRVAFDETTGSTATGVLDGTVAMADTALTNAVLLPEGQGAALRPGQSDLVAVPLLAAPVMKEDSTLQTREEIAFDYTAPADAHFIQGYVASDAGMEDLVAEARTSNGQPLALADLPEGQWFLRLTALSAEGLEGRARTFNFIRARNSVGGLSLSNELLGKTRYYRFKWSAGGEGEATFRFQISRANEDGEPQGQPLVDSPGLTDTAFSLTDLPPGTYSWRVEGTRYRFGHRLSAWSNPEVLTINR
ncbi:MULTISPECIES: FecR domain-containing protein [unclassified Brevundimonas]|uniref:FecR domain-containing protein n=1 Tax=unclassified Brevundimonas TaxID=2622653 RepID=UPI0025B8C378|nr:MULTISPECIES: FecR domain-containing protein [unclassified Brevundimonas]